MKTEKFELKMPDGACETYIAAPGNDAYPGVILYMDAFGPRGYLYEMAQKLASFGYFVLMPNMFYRFQRLPIVDVKFPLKAEQMPEVFPKIMPLFQKFSPEDAMKDAGVFLNYMADHKLCKKGKVGLTGYCMGGTLALRTAAQFPDRIAAVGSFHAGNLATDKPESPHLLLKKIKAELFIGHADNDQSMPPEQMERFDVALKEAKVKHKVELFKGAQHGFTMADLPAYNAQALERHWKVLNDLFARTLGH